LHGKKDLIEELILVKRQTDLEERDMTSKKN